MKKLMVYISVMVFAICSRSWAGPDCIYVPIDIKIIKLQNAELHILEQECINWPEGFIPNHLEAYFVIKNIDDASSNRIIEIGSKFDYQNEEPTRIREDYINILKTPPEFPFVVVKGTSYNNTILHLFTKAPELKKITKIENPVSAYQANNREGEENKIIGFYKSQNGDFYIEKLYIPDSESHKCNACQIPNVETLKITSSGTVSIGTRKFDIETYKARMD